jgi:hypothetical protein
MSMHATVNTNASSALNTQNSINSYDGGVQPLLLTATNSTYTWDGAAHTNVLGTLAVTTDESNLHNVSTINIDTTTLTLNGGNKAGIELTLTLTGASGAASSAARQVFEEANDTKYNVWSVDFTYGAGLSGERKDQFAPGGCSVEVTTPTGTTNGLITVSMPKADKTAFKIALDSITLHKRARGLALSDFTNT